MGEVSTSFLANDRGYTFTSKNSLHTHIQRQILALLNIPNRDAVTQFGRFDSPNVEPLDVYKPSTKKFRRGIYLINNVYYRVMGTVKSIAVFTSDKYDSSIIKRHVINVYSAVNSKEEQVVLSADMLGAPFATLVATVNDDGAWIAVGDTVSYQQESVVVSQIDKYQTNKLTVMGTAEHIVDMSQVVPDRGTIVPFGRIHVYWGYNPFKGCSSLNLVEPFNKAKMLTRLSLMMCEHKKAIFQDAKVVIDNKGVTFYNDGAHTTPLKISDLTIGPISAKRVKFSYDNDQLSISVKASVTLT